MKILYATDHHIKGRNPGSRIDDYPLALYKKMLEFEQACIYEKPDAVVFGGDLFDTPRVAFSIIVQYAKIFRRIRELGIPIYLVPGNHDLFGYSMDTIDQTAIGVLSESGLVKLLTRKRSYLLTDAKGVTVEIFGREYDKDIDTSPADYQVDPSYNARWNVLFSHGMLLQKPFHPDVRHTLTKDVRTKAHVVLNGHYHPGMEIHEENGTIFGNPGSTGRDEGSKGNIDRIPQYAIIEATKKKIDVTFVEYATAMPGDEVFDRTPIDEAKVHERYLEAFEQTIADAMTFDAFDPKDVLAELSKSNNIEQDVLDAAFEAIVEAEKAIQDNKLDGYIEKRRSIAITEIEIENFQSHKHTKIEFSPKGLNAITGASDSGKSAIIRALRWALYNEPKGSDFIRHGESRATVTVRFSDGSFITRTRTNSDAGSYIVGDAHGKTQEFKGFSNNIPIDVANTHQMPRVELAPGIERSLNFAYQLDGHFLLSEPPSVRAAVIGRLTGVHFVDSAIKEKRKDLLNLTKDINAAEKRIEELNEKLKEYDDLPQLKQQIDLATLLIQKLERQEKELDELRDMQAEIASADNDIVTYKKQLKEFADLPKAEKRLEKAERMAEELRDLEIMADDLAEASRDVKVYTERLRAFDRLDEAEQNFQKAEELTRELNELEEMYADLVEAEDAVSTYEKQLSRFGDLSQAQTLVEQAEALMDGLYELRQLHDELNSADADIRTFNESLDYWRDIETSLQTKVKDIFARLGNKCPMCRQDLDAEHMEHVIDAV
jgi:exonuclease SbcC